MQVKFYENADEALLKFAVIIAKFNGKWVLCKHKAHDTLEFPGGHREPHQSILNTAKRELQEETGAVRFTIQPICVYSVTGKNRVNATGEELFGMLYFAEIAEFANELHSETETVLSLDTLPVAHVVWTYPQIQPCLSEEFQRSVETE